MPDTRQSADAPVAVAHLDRGFLRLLWVVGGLSLALCLLMVVSHDPSFNRFTFVQERVHVAVETLSMAMAAMVFLFVRKRENPDPGLPLVRYSVGYAFLAMGILDLAHALMPAGNLFVWFHVLATLLGGGGLALVWLPAPRRERVPLALTVGLLLLCLGGSLLFPGAIPPMRVGPDFSPVAEGMNLAGGVLFLVAAVRIGWLFRRYRQLPEAIFALSAGMLGAASLVFPWSEVWGLDWWLWHLVRLLSFGVALLLVVYEYRATKALLQDRLVELGIAEQRLKESQERLTQATQANEIGLWDWNVQTQELVWDDTMFRLYGLRREDFSGSYEAWQASVSPEDLKPAEAALFKAVEGPDPFDYTFRVRLPQGGLRYISAKAAVIRDGEGRPLRMVGTNWDVTSKKVLELDLARRNTDLEAANRQLELRNRELDEFTYVASHDLQEPLRKLVSFSQLLKEDLPGEVPERAAKDLGFIMDAAHRMQVLIQDLLAFSRTGRAEVKPQITALDACLDAALSDLSVLLEESKGEVVRQPLPTVHVDPALIQRLFLNLVGNALKFTRPGEVPRVEISAASCAEGWRFEVRDRGIGIDPAHAEQIFAPFKRLHGRGEYGGTGIGLAICRKIVDRHGGRLWVESEEGQGARFLFTLPGEAPWAAH